MFRREIGKDILKINEYCIQLLNYQATISYKMLTEWETQYNCSEFARSMFTT